jgi:RNA polymerase primary sigma factor
MHAMKERDIFGEFVDNPEQEVVIASDELTDRLPKLPLSIDDNDRYPYYLMDPERDDPAESQLTPGDDDEPADEYAQEYERTEDLIQSYFHSMGDIVILTREEEKKLAQTLEYGRKLLREIITSLPLYREVEVSLTDSDQEGHCGSAEEKDMKILDKTLKVFDQLMLNRGPAVPHEYGRIFGNNLTGEAIERLHAKIAGAREIISRAQHALVMHNLRLVVHVVKQYAGRGLSLLDLIQEGNIGLMKAVDKFDYTKGFKLSTYATWWIRQAALRALIDQSKTIRLPVHMMDLYNTIVRTSRELLVSLGRDPRKEEIAARLEIPVRKVEEIMAAVQDPLALQTPIGEDESTLEDFISDDMKLSPYCRLEKEMMYQYLLKILHTLTQREEKIIRMRFGIGLDRQYTLEEVGRFLSLTRERVRQIEAAAMRKLRHPVRRRLLKNMELA